MRSNDPIPYMSSGGVSGPKLKRGTVVAWNTTTGANTINVDGTVLTDLELLVSSEKTLIAVGNVVSIVVDGPTWAILGKVTKP